MEDKKLISISSKMIKWQEYGNEDEKGFALILTVKYGGDEEKTTFYKFSEEYNVLI